MQSETTLILIAAITIVLLVVLVTRLKLHPFLALMVSAAFLGLASGLAPTAAISTFQKGFGNILSSVGLVVGLGSMLGGLLLNSGGADRIANAFVGRGATVWLPTSICAAALIIGMPHLFDVSFVMLVPLVFAIANRTHKHLMLVGLPMAAGLYVSHGFLLPHPSPVLALAVFHGDAGRAILFGFLLAIPIAILSGPVLTRFVMRSFKAPIDITHSPIMTAAGRSEATALEHAPALPVVLFTVLLPPGLMLLRTLLEARVPQGTPQAILNGLGNPIVSLAIAVLFAIWALGLRSGRSLAEVQRLLGKSLAPAAGVILVVGAGGGLKEMLVGTHLGDMIANTAAHWPISPLFLAWLVAALMRIAVGSATVATVTAAGLMAPIQALHPDISPELMTISVAAGGLMLSHLNDSGFWLFKEYFQLTVGETLRSWTVLVSVQSLLGLAGVMLLDLAIR